MIVQLVTPRRPEPFPHPLPILDEVWNEAWRCRYPAAPGVNGAPSGCDPRGNFCPAIGALQQGGGVHVTTLLLHTRILYFIFPSCVHNKPTLMWHPQVEKQTHMKAEQLFVSTNQSGCIHCWWDNHLFYSSPFFDVLFFHVTTRLSAQLLHTTWQQTELQCQSDLAKLRDWSHKFDLYATKQVWMSKAPKFIMFNLVATIPIYNVWVMGCYVRLISCPLWQAALDYKHINDRYHKGKLAIDEFMAEKHQFMRVQSLTLAHAAIVQIQGKMGPNAFLSTF